MKSSPRPPPVCAVFKAVRGEWGSGKTFAARLDRRAPLDASASPRANCKSLRPRPRSTSSDRVPALVERLSIGDGDIGGVRSVVDAWFYVATKKCTRLLVTFAETGPSC